MVFQSTHPSRGATVSSIGSIQTLTFQSTHPSRGATLYAVISAIFEGFQSTHPSRGATLFLPQYIVYVDVSIHAPLAGCDCSNSTYFFVACVSIHAPLAGCDSSSCRRQFARYCFNPRTPRGVRLHHIKFRANFPVFQSTHPSRGATACSTLLTFAHRVSIHAPLAGCDLTFL